MERVRRRSYRAAARWGQSSSVLRPILVRDTAIHQQSPECIQVCTKINIVLDFDFLLISGCGLNQFSLACRNFSEDYGMDFWSDDDDNEKMSRSWSSTSDDSFNCDVVGGNRRRPGHLYFEFFEVCSPYGRIPLMDKVNFYDMSSSSLSWLCYLYS